MSQSTPVQAIDESESAQRQRTPVPGAGAMLVTERRGVLRCLYVCFNFAPALYSNLLSHSFTHQNDVRIKTNDKKKINIKVHRILGVIFDCDNPPKPTNVLLLLRMLWGRADALATGYAKKNRSQVLPYT